MPLKEFIKRFSYLDHMSKLAAFLSELSDHELRAFHHFRFDQFMKGSKEKITLELENRQISFNNPDEFEKHLQLAREEGIFTKRASLCPRCLSEKFYTSHEVETITYHYASVNLDVDYRTCLVCLYSQDKVDNETDRIGAVGPIGFIRKLINRKR